MYELLVWLIANVRPSKVTGSNGLPLETNARPLVQLTRSCAVASLREVRSDVRVVGLVDRERAAVEGDRLERAAARDQRTATGPAHEILRGRFAARGPI